ncbi:MAG: Ni/Fe hydrogenase subunit alpha [Verrucomicrobiota bacterium]|nr:Ni/Fe hydrogenase subunit alpha [Verrucomicrobiota bacterium]
MPRQITIDPVTRIEGHAKITIQLDEAGNVDNVRFHVVEFRGFERFCEGRPFAEMPGITARICGICPVSHLLASAKACDRILSVDIPPAAEKLRRMMNLGQIIQSHALSFFHLSAPDFLLGWEQPPERRNLFGLVAAEPELARRGIRLRQFGQEVIETLGGRKIHPAWAVPGGVRNALTPAGRDALKARLPEAKESALMALERFKKVLSTHKQELQVFGNFPSLFLGLVTPNGTWEHYDGHLCVMDSVGNVICDFADPAQYGSIIGEAVETSSYLKSPYYKPLGYPGGMYRVGPLARLNIARQMGTPLADKELSHFKTLGCGAVNASFMYHYARLIEIVACIERLEGMLDDSDLLGTRLRADAGVNSLEGIGVSEAPRGTLFHHYNVDEKGVVRKVNLIIATGQNNLAMNRTVAQIARHYLTGSTISEPMLNRIEAGIRAFDPCLSCSTHADGRIALGVVLLDATGKVLDEANRL